MCNAAARAARRKYGRYMPYQRANVDQVPLPFVNGLRRRRPVGPAGPRLTLRRPRVHVHVCAQWLFLRLL